MAAPKTANICVTIGNSEYVVTHSNFSKLVVERTANDVNDNFELSVLDDDAYEIEGALLSGENFIQISYIDDTLDIYKTLAGFAYKISSSFINNRNMLTIKGLVGSGIKDKYQKYSFSWNVVPKFNMSQVLGDANANILDANYSVDSGLDQFFQGFLNFFKKSGVGWKSVFTDNWNSLSDYKEIIDAIFSKDLISIDQEGNYYIQKYKRDTNYAKNESNKMTGEVSQDDEDDNISKSEGSYVIPVKPHKLIKLICCGGKYSDILEKEYTDYKGTSFYDDDLSEAEWYYIKKWFEKQGSFSGMGYSKFNCNYDTVWSEDELTQVKESYMEFIYNNLLSKCVQKKDNKSYTNFYLSFEEGSGNNKGTVTMSRLDASAQVTNAPKYTYYGQFEDDGTNKGRMISFSPSLDIMTSMITQGTYVDKNSQADISSVNLTDANGKETKITVSAKSKSSEGRYNIKWGVVSISPASKVSSNKSIAESKIIKTFEDASELAYRASATISGFNKLTPQSYIEIVLLPKNNTGIPTHHHMSGTYFILSIKDTISDGVFTSDLNMIKNIGNMGNTAYVEDTENKAVADLKYTIKKEYTYINPKDGLLVNNVKASTSRNIVF